MSDERPTSGDAAVADPAVYAPSVEQDGWTHGVRHGPSRAVVVIYSAGSRRLVTMAAEFETIWQQLVAVAGQEAANDWLYESMERHRAYDWTATAALRSCLSDAAAGKLPPQRPT